MSGHWITVGNLKVWEEKHAKTKVCLEFTMVEGRRAILTPPEVKELVEALADWARWNEEE